MEESRRLRSVVGVVGLWVLVFAAVTTSHARYGASPVNANFQALEQNVMASMGEEPRSKTPGGLSSGLKSSSGLAESASNSASHPEGSDLVAHSGADASQTGKHTWAASDPVALATWWLEFLPTTEWMLGNYSTDGGCATYGKVFVGNESTESVHGVNAPFQLHAVRAWKRPSGPLSIAALEAKFSTALERWGVDGQASQDLPGGSASEATQQQQQLAPQQPHRSLQQQQQQQHAPLTEPLGLNAAPAQLQEKPLEAAPAPVVRATAPAQETQEQPPAPLEGVGAAQPQSQSSSNYELHALAPLAENCVGLYTEDLAWYARAFSSAGVAFAVLAWDGAQRAVSTATTEGASQSFHSLIVHVPDSLVVLELMGPAMDESVSNAARRASRSWRRVATALPPAAHAASYDARGRPSLTAVKISYATTDAARDSAWAEQALSATPLSRATATKAGGIFPAASFSEQGALSGAAAYGVDARALSWVDDSAPIELHYVQPSVAAQKVEAALERRDDASQSGGGALTAAAYEQYAARLHAENTGPSCENCDDVTGFDRLMDTHFGRRLLDAGGATARALDASLNAVKQLNAPVTVWKKGPSYFLYIGSPSGAAAQLTGSFDDPPKGVRDFDTCLV